MKKIFISYSHKDHIFANAIARFLIRRGYQVWIDSKQLQVGANWSEDIDEALKQADYVFGILSADSVRRPEVIRELCIALNQKKEQFLVITIGRIHHSWFFNSRSPKVLALLNHIKTYQHIEFNGRGDITEAKMRMITEYLARGHNIVDNHDASAFVIDGYIAVNGMPEEMIDSHSGNRFYKVYAYDLSFLTGYPFALDNQWVPEIIFNDENYRLSFEKDGFSSQDLKDIIKIEQQYVLYKSLLHMRQLVINKSAILNTLALRQLYMQNEDCDSFIYLLKRGVIVVFLYGDGEMTPFVNELPDYETDSEAVECWNKLCKQVPVYCIRENWGNTIDQHSIDFVKYCCTIADDIEDIEILSNSFGMDLVQRLRFFSVLKDIAVQGFIKTRMTGTNIYQSMKGLSRSYFYKSFIVREKSKASPQPTLNCLFDKEKPFHYELKRMVDMFYNSIFTNYFNCRAIIPSDMPIEMTFLSQRYLKHSTNDVEEEEIEYALSEFLAYQDILESVSGLGEEIFINNWDLKKVVELRNKLAWTEYISTMESIVMRSSTWQVDFSEIGNLVKKFVSALSSFHFPTQRQSVQLNSFSFRISIGSSVTDIVVGKGRKMFKDVKGAYKDNQNPIQISFQLGDITNSEVNKTVFYPVCIFDGITAISSGEEYHDKLIHYLIDNDFKRMAI